MTCPDEDFAWKFKAFTAKDSGFEGAPFESGFQVAFSILMQQGTDSSQVKQSIPEAILRTAKAIFDKY